MVEYIWEICEIKDSNNIFLTLEDYKLAKQNQEIIVLIVMPFIFLLCIIMILIIIKNRGLPSIKNGSRQIQTAQPKIRHTPFGYAVFLLSATARVNHVLPWGHARSEKMNGSKKYESCRATTPCRGSAKRKRQIPVASTRKRQVLLKTCLF